MASAWSQSGIIVSGGGGGGAATSGTVATDSATGFVIADPTTGKNYYTADSRTDRELVHVHQRFSFNGITFVDMPTNITLVLGAEGVGEKKLSSNLVILQNADGAPRALTFPSALLVGGMPVFILNISDQDVTLDDFGTTVLAASKGALFIPVAAFGVWACAMKGA